MPTHRTRATFSPEAEQVLRLKVKAELRKSMQRIRAFTPKDVRAASSASIVERVLALPVVAAARSVALFRTIDRKAEVDTRALDAALRARGVRLAYPYLDGPSDDAVAEYLAWQAQAEVGDASRQPPIPTMGFRWVDSGLSGPSADDVSFEELGRGFEEPRADLPVVEADGLDVVVVPGLAFDPLGYRLGYGAGYYDRALGHFPRAVRVGVAFDFQYLMEIPKTEHDVPVTWVVTEKRVVQASMQATEQATAEATR